MLTEPRQKFEAEQQRKADEQDTKGNRQIMYNWTGLVSINNHRTHSTWPGQQRHSERHQRDGFILRGLYLSDCSIPNPINSSITPPAQRKASILIPNAHKIHSPNNSATINAKNTETTVSRAVLYCCSFFWCTVSAIKTGIAPSGSTIANRPMRNFVYSVISNIWLGICCESSFEFRMFFNNRCNKKGDPKIAFSKTLSK